MRCRTCGNHIAMDVSTCAACASPADERAFCGEPSRCTACRGLLWSLARVCVHCGTEGYPAIRLEVATMEAQPRHIRPGSTPLLRLQEAKSPHHRRPTAREPNRVMP